MARTVFATALLLLLAACGSTAPPAAQPPTTTTSAPTTATSASTATSTSTTPSTTSAPFTAANGRNLKACSGGTCEVFVKSGDTVTIKGLGKFTFQVSDGSVAMDIVTTSFAGHLAAAGPASFTDPNGADYTIGPVAVQGDEAVVRVSKQ